MAGPPPDKIPGPTRVVIDVKSDKVEEWKEQYKHFLLSVKDSNGYFRYRWGPWSEDMSKLEIIASTFATLTSSNPMYSLGWCLMNQE